MANIKYILFLICLSEFFLTLGCNSTTVFKQKLTNSIVGAVSGIVTFSIVCLVNCI